MGHGVEFYFLGSAGCHPFLVLLLQKKKHKICCKSLYRFCTFAAMAQMQEALNQGHEV
jgi:hypothetical protein